MAKYKTISNEKVSNKELLKLSPFFRELRRTISSNGIDPNGKIKLEGKFGENTLSLDKYLLNNINIVSDVDMSFIIKVNYNDESFLFTSATFLQRLVKSYSENNPYLILTSLSEIIEIDLDPIIDRVNTLLELETEDGVEMDKNIFTNIVYDSEDNPKIEVDYNELIKYINWTVTKSSQNYDERLLSSDELSEYRILEPSDRLEEEEDEEN